MPLTEKEVFYALLKNHHISLLALCNQADLSYQRLVRKLEKGQLQDAMPSELIPICNILGISYEDLFGLLQKAGRGEFPDDYPREEIRLPLVDKRDLEERTIVMLLTPAEKKIIEERRKAIQEAVERAIGHKRESV